MAASMPFDEKLESWDSYKERLEHYFIATDIDDPIKKKAILVNSVGPANYERLRNLCFPSSPNDKDYDELVVIFSKLFTPSIVVFKERKQFYYTRKNKNEMATDWHERVRRLALNCKFGPRTEQTLLDKFVTSYDGIVFDRFCEEGADLTLAKALEIAQRYETIEASKPPNQLKNNENQRDHSRTRQQQQQQQHQHQQHRQQQHHQNKQNAGQNQQAQATRPKKNFPKNVNRPVTNVSVNLNVKKSDK